MAAIGRPIVTLAAEVVGYSRLIRADEKGALEQLKAHRDQFVDPKIAEHSGRIVRAAGNSLVVEFESPTEAVRCAVELQSGMIDRNIRTLTDRRITFRIGVAIDQVTGNGDDLVSRAVAALPRDTLVTLIKPGAGVYAEPGNTAVRLAALAEPAGICISEAVRDAIGDQLPYEFKGIGEQKLEIHAAPVHCYTMNADTLASGPRLAAQNQQRRPVSLRNAAVAVGVLATVAIWGAALWAWFATNSSTALIHAPATADAHVPSSADWAAPALSSRQSPLMSITAPDSDIQTSDIQTPAAPPTPLASGTVADTSIQPPSSRLALSEIGEIVVRGKQAPAALQTAADNGTGPIGAIQSPPVLLTPNGATVVRGKQEVSALQFTPDSGPTVIRGNQAPPAPEIAPNGATDVVRGTRVFSPAPLSSRPDQR